MAYQEYFRGKVCVVTGAASGIGLGLSKALLGAGATVVLADRDIPRLTAVVQGLGEGAEAVPCDVTREEQVQGLLEGAVSRHGRLDVLFNNAGVPGTVPIERVTLADWRRQIEINLWGVVCGVHFALPIMRRQGGGHIVNTASFAGLVPLPMQAMYAATKFGVVGLSESLRLELEEEGIRVSVLCPGNVVSGIFGVSHSGEAVDNPPPPDAVPTEEAVEIILEAVASRDGIVVLPADLEAAWLRYRTAPEEAEESLRELRRQRKAAFLAGGRIS